MRITPYSEPRVDDMDNLVKPIQGALQGIAYLSDGKVDVAGNPRDINGRLHVRYISPSLARPAGPDWAFADLAFPPATVSFG